MVGKLWNNYNASKAYDGYFTNENKLRKHAVIISSILEKIRKRKTSGNRKKLSKYNKCKRYKL